MRKHRYVSLVSVLAVLLSAFAIVGLGLFIAAFLYRWSTYDQDRFDLINVHDNIINFLTVIMVFCMILLVGYYAYLGFLVYMAHADGCSYTPSVTAAFPFICIVLDYLAFRGILKDELIVRSLDRLR